MDKSATSFTIGMPLMKSERSATDEWGICGMASCESRDLQNEIIVQKGIDCTPAVERGWINWDHGRGAGDQIGIPTVLEIARIEDHPVMRKSGQHGWGLYAEAILLKGVKQAEDAWVLLNALKDVGEMRRLSWSIQGRAVERDTLNRSVNKSELYHLALTHQPIQTESFAQVIKSLSTTSAEPNMLENLDGNMTSVLYGECNEHPSHYDKHGVFKGKVSMLKHLVDCRGHEAMESARLVKALGASRL